MNNYFEKEISSINRELTSLKTSGQKSSAFTKTISRTVNVTAQLQYEDISYPTGSARAEVAYEVVTTKDALIIPSLSWYYEDVFMQELGPARVIDMFTGILSNGNYVVYLYFIGSEEGDNSDAARTKRGETVMVSVDLSIVCTQDFTLRKIL